MTYTANERSAGRLVVAMPGTLCEGRAPYQMGDYECKGSVDEAGNRTASQAVHQWHGVNLCGFHSPFDVTDEDRATFNDYQARANGTVTDEVEVPVGSNKATPDWTRRVESTIVNAERMVRNGVRPPEFSLAVVNEVARLNRRKIERAARNAIDTAQRECYNGLMTEAHRDTLVSAALDSTRHVSLDK